MRNKFDRAIEVVAAELWILSQSDCMTWDELTARDPATASHFRDKANGLIHRAGLNPEFSNVTDRSFKDFLIFRGKSA